MVAGTKRRKLPNGASSSTPRKRTKRTRGGRSKRQPANQEESPSPGISTSSSSRSPSPTVEFVAPPCPELARWRCCRRGCGMRGWPLTCLNCGRARNAKCDEFIDYNGWKARREWKRWKVYIESLQAAGDYDYGIRFTPTSIFVPHERLNAVSQMLDNMESERVLLLGDGLHSCFADCYVPGECNAAQRVLARLASSRSSKERSSPPSPALPDSPKSPPPSDDEDVGWIDAVPGIDGDSSGAREEDAGLVRPRPRLPSPLLPSDGAPEIYEDEVP
ncbi:unnamed protein product [Clonostachys rosea]|uniref:Zn(2)-C6 fungal-type domain-containing protein n=1 Tax=Bionectria ochroleuca TaxID=29856 RepID=A0ABY6U2D2_BIOOC|nr:unnamed protein product [Clonostachys rosea]